MTRAKRRAGTTIAGWLRALLSLYQDVLCELGLRTCRFCRDCQSARPVPTGDAERKKGRKS